MNIILAFIFGGFLCLIGQILLDKFKLLPVHITVLYVFLGSILECFNIYDKLVAKFNTGALAIISSFGHSLTDSAVKNALEKGFIGLFEGIFTKVGMGVSVAVISAFIISLITKSKN